MTYRVGIVGASGYGGAELLRLLAAHPQLEVATVAAHSQAGMPIAELFPNLPGDRRFDPVDPAALAELDLVFLATPHGPAIELGAALADAGVRTVDLSAGFRLDAEAFTTWYGEQHPRTDLLPPADVTAAAPVAAAAASGAHAPSGASAAAGASAAHAPVGAPAQVGASAASGASGPARAVYGLTEFARAEVADAVLVANPGCYVITALLGLLPLAPLLVPGSLIVDGKSGTTGAGRAAKDALHASHVAGSIGAYGAPGHRHTGEIERYLGVHGADLGAISFTPHLLPVPRGLLITAYAGLGDGVTPDDVQGALVEAYADEPFVHVLAPGTFPVTKAVVGSNACQVSAVVDPRTRRVVVTSVTDNLGKGAAGGALQNANVMLGLPETTGLATIGVYP